MISFVLPAFNEESFLGRTLQSIHDAARDNAVGYEIIVVDDASTDGTAAIARAGGARVVPVSHRQIAATRNAGAREATGETIVFLDADTVLPGPTLAAALSALDEGVVGGGADVQFDGEIPFYAVVGLDAAKRLLRIMRLAPGCFLFCTREAYEGTGGFDETLYASEECFFSLALRKQGRFVILRESVITSGRKIRQYSAWKLMATLGRLSLTGGRACRSRKGLEVWYDGTREESAPDLDDVTAPASRD